MATWSSASRLSSLRIAPKAVIAAKGVALPEGDWDSVGGLVFSELGRVPEVGDEVRVDGAVLRVERMDGRRVAALRVSRVSDDEPTEDSDDD